MITFPWYLHVIAIGLTAFGLWKAGDGWRYGWIIAWTNTLMWFVFGILTWQPMIFLGAIAISIVLVRNFFVGRNDSKGFTRKANVRRRQNQRL